MDIIHGAVRTSLLASVFMCSSLVQAHLLVVQPDRFTVRQGEDVRVNMGLSEPLITMDLSLEKILAKGYGGKPGVASLSSYVLYRDGSEAVIENLVPVNLNNPSDVNPANANANQSKFTLQKSGTAVINARMQFNSGKRPTIAYGKTFLNWQKDNLVNRRLAGNDVLEIVFTGNIGPVRVGQTVTVQAFLRGKPLANAEISATYDGAPTHEGSEENDYIVKKTNRNGQASFKMDRPNQWVIGIEYVDEKFNSNNPAYPENTGVRYRSSILFPVK